MGKSWLGSPGAVYTNMLKRSCGSTALGILCGDSSRSSAFKNIANRSRGSPKSWRDLWLQEKVGGTKVPWKFLGKDWTPKFPTNFPCSCRIESLPTKAIMIPFFDTMSCVTHTDSRKKWIKKGHPVKIPYGVQLNYDSHMPRVAKIDENKCTALKPSNIAT